ncbi:MAG: glycosyl hydrolase family 28 protein [Bacteroidales bacterium]|nr:glycosyl hydrolase family 28 protein [Bacteroidales bacterium]
MKSLKIFLIILLTISSPVLRAKDYHASLFGICSDGMAMNTKSIQYAIDFIHDNGGGTLVFYVGRYVTGSIHLKSDVAIKLEEGAILVGSLNPLDYETVNGTTAMILAEEEHDIAITGKGVIDGRGFQVANNLVALIQKGVVKDPLKYDRPRESIRPMNIYFHKCTHILIQDITLKDPGSWNQTYNQCKNLIVENILVDSKSYWNNDGIDIVDCDSVSITNSCFDAADDGICLKSHDAGAVCSNIVIRGNRIRTSANGIKFGTASYGGFRHVRIIGNVVYDTYRSAITFAAVDGGFVEDVVVDSLRSINTGNVIFLRIGERRAGRKGRMNNISISNVYAQVPSTKPDAGYRYEGPVEDMPRNVSPASIVGMPDARIQNVTLKNIEIHYPGGGDPEFAKVGLDELDMVPEMASSYPEFSMFKELPAWGFYIRHTGNITFDHVTLICDRKDYRTAIVMDDVQTARFFDLKVSEPSRDKKPVFTFRCSEVELK